MKIIEWVMPHWLPIMRVIEFIGVLTAIFVFLWDFTVERPVDRAVRKATLFAQMAQTHALADGAGLKALRPTVLALVEEAIPIEGQILRGVDLSKANLRKAQFLRSDFTDADLTRADLTDAYLSGADLTDADFSDPESYPRVRPIRGHDRHSAAIGLRVHQEGRHAADPGRRFDAAAKSLHAVNTVTRP